MKYLNFYENILEAHARLKGTIVLYDGLPYNVLAITDHCGDGIFRMYLLPVAIKEAPGIEEIVSLIAGIPPGYSHLGTKIDSAMEKYPECGLLRKQMNSPKFNKFRPFPLGMCNIGTQVYYVERQPIRPAMHQGLTKSACYETLITAGSRNDNPRRSVTIDINSPEFRDCIMGDHYAPDAALRHLSNPQIANDALAFHREFAFCRGPLDAIYLAYRSDIIGIVPNRELDCVVLGREFRYCREVVSELHLFNRVH